ncbi:FKBP-type peptidyl-prolyl cis-trans isomerase [Roseateles sp.]|uniref:FKBP-type peptidyl-prolyl cis-trans isomerase n=1 Tax=Roseateles sp. TaxID=1971397 RepID=UPI0039ED2FAD
MSFALSRRSALLLALSASLGLAACGGGGGDAGTPVNQDPNGWSGVTALKTTDTVVGTGTAIETGKLASVAYTGWIYDARVADTKGTKIDSNVDAAPLSFVVGSNALISGFEQGVVGMKPGGKRTVTMPASMAYGSAGKAPSVPANAALVFDIVMDPNGWTGVTALKTQDTVAGAGASADAGKNVTVTYTLWLYDARIASTKGLQIENNTAGYTFKLGAGSVIAGFDQGISGMKQGGKRTITIPASLGYGNGGDGSGKIPGGAVLVFDVQLTAVN